MLKVQLDSQDRIRYEGLCDSLGPKSKNDRYESFVSMREHPMYKDTYIVNEKDNKKGFRTIQLNSKFDAIIRQDKAI